MAITALMQIFLLALGSLIVTGSFAAYIWLTSRRKQNELAQRMVDAQYAFDHALCGIARVNLDGVFVSANANFAESIGGKQDTILGDDWRRFVHPDYSDVVERSHSQMLLGDPVSVEIQCLRPNQTVRDVQLMMLPAQDRNRRIIGHYCFTLDITARKTLERTIHSLEIGQEETAGIHEGLLSRKVSG
jgi:PAS domain S-box-containing protein